MHEPCMGLLQGLYIRYIDFDTINMAATVQTKPCLSHPSFKVHWAPNPSTERGDHFHIGTHPKEPTKIIYPSGKFIIVRDVANPAETFVYRGHNAKTTVAKFSPNGFWVASADIMGKVTEHALEIHGQMTPADFLVLASYSRESCTKECWCSLNAFARCSSLRRPAYGM